MRRDRARATLGAFVTALSLGCSPVGESRPDWFVVPDRLTDGLPDASPAAQADSSAPASDAGNSGGAGGAGGDGGQHAGGSAGVSGGGTGGSTLHDGGADPSDAGALSDAGGDAA